MTSLVTEIETASPHAAKAHFAARLSFETDCSDVRESMQGQDADFVLLDVRGPSAFATAHVPGAVNLPHREISEQRMAEWPQDTMFVVYCAGPHCNGADKAAWKLASLDRKVKIMIGGMTGWADERFPLVGGRLAAE